MKVQSSMIAIVFSVLILVFIMFFLISSSFSSQASEATKSEYRNLYAHNMLLSILRMDTECGVFSDVLKAAYFGGGKCHASEFLESRLPSYIGDLLNSTGHTDYDWFFQAAPIRFHGDVINIGDSGIPQTTGFWDARTIITWEGYRLEVKLYIRTK